MNENVAINLAFVKNEKLKKYFIGLKSIKTARQEFGNDNIEHIRCNNIKEAESKIMEFFSIKDKNEFIINLNYGNHVLQIAKKNEPKYNSTLDKNIFESLKVKDTTIYSINNESIIFISKNFDLKTSKLYVKNKISSRESDVMNDMKYLIKFDNETKRPKENVVSKISKKTLLGNCFILFNDYYLATTFLATFYCKNIFLIKNIALNKYEKYSAEEARQIILENINHDDLKISWFNSEEKLNQALEDKKKEEESKENSETLYNIYVDGSCNPSKEMYSWAFVVYYKNKEIYFDKGHETQKKYIQHGSQIGEFLAMCNAMKFIVENKLNNVIVWYDNIQNFNCMEALNTKSNLFTVYSKYFSYTSELRNIMIKHNLSVDYKHVKAHSGILGNERADKLAKKAINDVNSIF